LIPVEPTAPGGGYQGGATRAGPQSAAAPSTHPSVASVTGDRATRHAAALAFGQTVAVEARKRDR